MVICLEEDLGGRGRGVLHLWIREDGDSSIRIADQVLP